MTPQEQAQNAKVWIERLEKTRVKQGKGRLGDKKSGYCCLGFGCHIFDIDYKPRDEVSDEFRDFVGLEMNNGCRAVSDLGGLARRNDEGDTFNQIAKAMREDQSYFKPEVAEELEKIL